MKEKESACLLGPAEGGRLIIEGAGQDNGTTLLYPPENMLLVQIIALHCNSCYHGDNNGDDNSLTDIIMIIQCAVMMMEYSYKNSLSCFWR